jgi:hypothetical protein
MLANSPMTPLDSGATARVCCERQKAVPMALPNEVTVSATQRMPRLALPFNVSFIPALKNQQGP